MKWNCEPVAGRGGGRRCACSGRWARRLVTASLPWLALAVPSGCGKTFGAMLYFSGLVPGPKVEPVYKLTRGPLLILVDDDYQLLPDPALADALVEALAEEFREHDVNRHVIDTHQLRQIRQARADFPHLAADRVGRIAGASEVLWIQIEEFSTEADSTGHPLSGATFAVNVRVLSARADRREDVRRWPTERQPHVIRISDRLASPSSERDLHALHTKLIRQMAAEIARLFYEHREEE